MIPCPFCCLQVQHWFRIYHHRCRVYVNPGTTSTPTNFPTLDPGWASASRGAELQSTSYSVFCSYSFGCWEIFERRSNSICYGWVNYQSLELPKWYPCGPLAEKPVTMLQGNHYVSMSLFLHLLNTEMWKLSVLNVKCLAHCLAHEFSVNVNCFLYGLCQGHAPLVIILWGSF